MKAREIRETCNGVVDKKVITALCSLAERVSQLEHENVAMARALTVMAESQLKQGAIQETMADKIKKMRGDSDDKKPI